MNDPKPDVLTLKMTSFIDPRTDALMTRSQAKRLMSEAEGQNKVDLDFEGIPFIGPSFADEVFRVWSSSHPGTSVGYRNAIRDVEIMIIRARTERTSQIVEGKP